MQQGQTIYGITVEEGSVKSVSIQMSKTREVGMRTTQGVIDKIMVLQDFKDGEPKYLCTTDQMPEGSVAVDPFSLELEGYGYRDGKLVDLSATPSLG